MSADEPLRAAVVVPTSDDDLVPDLEAVVVASAPDVADQVVFDGRIPELGLLQFGLPEEMAGRTITLAMSTEVEPGVEAQRTCSLVVPGTSVGVGQEVAAASETGGELTQASNTSPTPDAIGQDGPLVGTTPPPNNQGLIGLIGVLLLLGVIVASLIRYRLLH